MKLYCKVIALCFCLSFFVLNGRAQQLNWAHATGGPLFETSNYVYTDNAGNVYIAGRFSGANVDFDPSPAGTFLLSSAGMTDAFVAKYDANGLFLWAFRYGGASHDETMAVTVDQNNNVYITGYFRGTNIDFDPGAGVANLTSVGDAGADPGYGGDIVVARYTAAGQYVWAFNAGSGELYDSGIAIGTDGAGDVYVGGYFKNSVDFNPGAGNAILNSANGGSIFLAKYSSAGAYQWVFNLGAGNTNNAMFDLKIDAAGNVYTTGYFQGSGIDFDPGPGNAPLSSAGSYEIFVAKYNTNGQYQFAFKAGSGGMDVGRGIALDATGNIYMIGDFFGTVDFNPGPGTNLLTSNGQGDVVIAKYNAAGEYQWAFNFGGTPNEYGWKVVVDGSHLFVTGSFSGTADFDPSAGVENLTSAGAFDIFIGKYSLNGEYLCSFRIGSPGDDSGSAVFSPSNNVFYMTGYFTNTNIDFDPSANVYNLSSAGDKDVFLAKYFWPDNPFPTGNITGDVICVGEQAQLTFNATSGVAPFTVTYSNGTTNFTQTNVQSGVPFNIPQNPVATTTYTLVSIKDAQRCAESNFTSATTTVTVNTCNGSACDSWLNLPSLPSYVTVGDLDVVGNKLTVEALVNRVPPLNAGLHYGHLVSKHTHETNVNYAMQLLGCEITTDVTGYVALFPNCSPVTDKTYHVAMVYDGNTLKFYRNGFLMGQTPVTGNMINNDLLTKIGQVAGPTNPFLNQTLGYVNEVRVWNVAKTQAQLRANMGVTLANPTTEPGLLGYYIFNNLFNKQGNPAFNGVLNGGAIIGQSNPQCNLIIDSCEMDPPPPTIPDFQIPDTVCVNTPVNIVNTTTGNTTSSFWNFCVGNINSTPEAVNLGNIGNQLQLPVFIDYVQYNGNYYGFVTNNMPGKLTRLDFGNSLLNTPTAVNLGNVGGIIPDACEDIQIVFTEGRWYAIIVGGNSTVPSGSRIVKLDFGPNLTNTNPVGTNWGNIGGLNYPGPLHLFNDNGNWYAFTLDANSSVTRFSFGPNFLNPPTATNFGNVGGLLNWANGIHVISDNGQWYAFLSSRNNSSIIRLNFGNSLLNTPTATNLGNPNNTLNQPRDIYIIKFCGELVGFVVNEGSNTLVKLNFSDITSIPTGVSMGNVGNLSFPHSISKLFRVGSDLYSFIPNVNNNTLTRLRFAGCTNASIPNFTGTTPPAVTYTTPGTYNINLMIDEGLPTQSSVCKQIVVKDCGRSISGVINDYTEVLAFDPCKNALTVTNATAFNVGDTVLIMQMKGAVVDSTNTAAFGTITDYKNSGNYEFNYVKNKTGNVIELTNYLTRQYDIPDGKVQLIRVPYFTDASIVSTLTCLPWDGGKGGVLAFNVQNKITLNNNIDVSGKGFRGGLGFNTGLLVTNCFTNNYYYPSTSTAIAAIKGESISTVSNDRIRGKGALAGAGGGGLDHNSGGGGGGNAGTGGFGGYQLEPCGNSPFDNRGIGGKNLIYNNATNKVFMGSGGGAGHANNPLDVNFPPSGGNGSGIVIISAQSIENNSFRIMANGADAPGCPVATTTDCHDGMGGGGAGGSVLLNIGSITDNSSIDIKGGKGADVSGSSQLGGRIGAGGGGGGGTFWYSGAAIPGNLAVNAAGGLGGVLLTDANNPWGTTPGSIGINLTGLQLPISTVPFKPNIDSVRINKAATGCRSFDFAGLGYTNTNPIGTWQWYFGDGGTANTQNTNHTYANAGTFTVKLVVTDINGCKDSITTTVTSTALNFDFSYDLDACNPLLVNFVGAGISTANPYWHFGDGNFVTGVLTPTHTFATTGNYIITYSVTNGVCTDTIRKTISLVITNENIIRTQDTTICAGTVKQLRTEPSLDFCWSPTTYLDNPNSPNPTTSTPDDIMYYFVSQSTGTNLIVNGDFSQGNTGFTSQYTYAPPPNLLGAQYYVGTNPQAWNVGMVPCTDHTTGTGNMLLVNGSSVDNEIVWSQTITVQPNTNYAFSTWIQHITIVDPSRLQFSINGINVGTIFEASTTSCLWQRFYTTWNSGNSTTAVISIVNKSLVLFGNDFALDDISFAPIFIKRDSVKITVEKPVVRTNNDDAGCEGIQVQLNTTGAANYVWTPSTGLSNPNIANPIATPTTTTEYIVTGTTANGCVAKDTVNITIHPKPTIVKSPNTTICKTTSAQLSVSGGTSYAWTPDPTLSDLTISNPVATPVVSTMYYVTVTDANVCTNIDSIKVDIHPDAVFSVNAPPPACEEEEVQLTASGGNVYVWSPAAGLSNAGIANPVATPTGTTTYTVQITETTCNSSTTLTTTVNVLALPTIQANKQNDIDCSNDRSQLNASGGVQYEWTPATTLNNANISNPVATPSTNTQYIVKGTDGNGCSNFDSVTVNVLPINQGGYYMPNAFTPNGDGLNDCYGIRYWGLIQELEFGIYNRWGERIFFTKNPNDCWDGVYKGKKQDIGVYVYMIKAKTFCGDTFKKGYLVLTK